MENIRDNSYKSPEEVKRIQNIVGYLGQLTGQAVIPNIERTETAQLNYTMTEGWDSEGRYIFPHM